MRITANQVTLARIVLLPVPACMLIYGETIHWWIAFSLFVILGATDFIDGWMARIEGPTRLGSLIDPVADKIFVAAIMLSLVATGVFAPWMISVLLSREFLMTALRSSVAIRQETMKTSLLGKFKTIIQMGGLGTIFFTLVLPGPVLVLVALLLSLPFLGASVFYIIKKKKQPYWILPVFVAFVLVASLAAFCTKEVNLLVQMWLIITITWASAIDYVAGTFKLFRRTGIKSGDYIRILWSIVYGLLVVPLVAFFPEMVLPLLVSTSLEFGLGGVDNVVVLEEHVFSYWPFMISVLAGLAFAFGVNYFIFSNVSTVPLYLSLLLALVSAINFSVMFIKHFALFKRGA